MSEPSQPAVGPSGRASTHSPIRAKHAQAATVPGFDFRIDYGWATSMGTKREHNQDTVSCDASLALFIVADGMGGHAAGEVASRTAVAAVRGYLRTSEARACLRRYGSKPDLDNRREVFGLLGEAMQAANRAVLRAVEEDSEREGMGTTLDLALLVRDRAFFAHVGDSRAYLVRPTTMLQLTHDHAAYDSLRTSGKRAPTRMLARSPLTNSIGHGKRLVVDTLFVDLTAGDRVVLCTDGIFDTIESESELAEMCRKGEPNKVGSGLIRHARDTGSNDDASVVVVSIGERVKQRKSAIEPRHHDLEVLAASPLFAGLEPADLLSALAASVEVDLDEGEEVPRAVANDRVAYVLLDGLVQLGNGRTLGAPALLLAESLVDVHGRGKLPTVSERARLLRIRHDDFNEVCDHNPLLAVELYKRIARHLAQGQR